MTGLKVVSLFTGCGGLDYGLHQAGHEIILQCENDPGAQQVLKAAFPGTLLVPDIVALSSLPPETELLAAGFPCIDVSRAGLRRGLDGPSTGLVRHVFRLLERAARDRRPVPWVLLENVEALLDRRSDGPPVVAWLAAKFEALGYRSWAHRVVCSAGFGVPNRRKRVFMLASMHGDARDVLLAQGATRCLGGCLAAVGADCWECFDPDDLKGDASTALGGCSYALDLGNARSAAGVDVVPTFTTSNDRMCLLLAGGRCGLLRIEDAERLQGLPPGHTIPAAALASGTAPGGRESREGERRRFQLLGNAVTAEVARWVGERLAAPYEYKYLPTEADAPLPPVFQQTGGGCAISRV